VEIGEFQRRLREIYETRDRARGRDATFMWLVEEVGELSRALRRGDAANLREEFSDALAWLVSVATMAGVDMDAAAARYADGCPRCGRAPCACRGERGTKKPAGGKPRRRGKSGKAVRNALLVLFFAASPAAAQEGSAPPAPPPPVPAPPVPDAGSSAAPATPPPAKLEVVWRKDLDAAKAAAREGSLRIVAVVTEEFYPSELCARLEKAVEEEPARAALAGLVALRIVEKEDLAFSKALGLQDLGHPYTALLDSEGKYLAHLRGAVPAAAWAKEIGRLLAAAASLDRRRDEARKDASNAKALFGLSEAWRELRRDREADDVLARAENADPDDRAGLLPLFRFRRVEARVEDRMAAQDFEGARALLDAYDREFPTSPRKPWIAFYRAVTRAYRGETEPALEDLRELAAGAAAKDESLLALVTERVASLEKVIDRKK